jgi:hypothetical protein
MTFLTHIKKYGFILFFYTLLPSNSYADSPCTQILGVCPQTSGDYPCAFIYYNIALESSCYQCAAYGQGTFEIVAGGGFDIENDAGLHYTQTLANSYIIPSNMVDFVGGTIPKIKIMFNSSYQPYTLNWYPPSPSDPAVCPSLGGVSKSFFTSCDCGTGGGGTGGEDSVITDCQLSSNFTMSGIFCGTNTIDFTNTSIDLEDSIISYEWNFGDGTSDIQANPSHAYSSPGTYLVSLIVDNDSPNNCKDTMIKSITIDSLCDLPCTSCIGSFSPTPNKKYIISTWAKENIGSSPLPNNYTKASVSLIFTNSTGGTTTAGPFLPKGLIIDSWQRIDEEFFIPQNTVNVQVKLNSSSGEVYFDDLRIFPFDASVKSFVYDPISLRFVTELDERNYGTFYEYDAEGNLVRTKKETERGIMTIQESRSNLKK